MNVKKGVNIDKVKFAQSIDKISDKQADKDAFARWYR